MNKQLHIFIVYCLFLIWVKLEFGLLVRYLDFSSHSVLPLDFFFLISFLLAPPEIG